MVYRHVSRKDPAADSAVAPAYTQRLDLEPIPKYRMPEHGAAPETAYRLINEPLPV
jgi:glutamate/tyrosine decarboxylase-like PLP-dependent enzyme